MVNKLMYLIMIAGAMVLAGGVPVSARIVDLQDFESGTVGNDLGMDGWFEKTEYAMDSFFTESASVRDSNMTGKIADCNSYGGQISKKFNSASNITDNDTDVYIRCIYIMGNEPFTVAPLISYGLYAPLGVALGITDNSGTGGQGFKWTITKASGAEVWGDNVAWYKSYEVLLQIKYNKTTPSASTGTLYHRDFGQTVWTADSILQNINLALSSTTKPSLWGSWFVRAQYNGSFDNITLGTGDIHNCVPSSADINSDCKVNLADFAIIAKSWLQ